MFPGCNGIGDRAADDLEILYVEFEAAGCPAVGADVAMDDDRRLLRQVVGLLEFFVADGGFRHNGLNEAGAVANRQEVDFSARPAVGQPAADRHELTLVFGDVFDVSVQEKLPASRSQLTPSASSF